MSGDMPMLFLNLLKEVLTVGSYQEWLKGNGKELKTATEKILAGRSRHQRDEDDPEPVVIVVQAHSFGRRLGRAPPHHSQSRGRSGTPQRVSLGGRSSTPQRVNLGGAGSRPQRSSSHDPNYHPRRVSIGGGSGHHHQNRNNGSYGSRQQQGHHGNGQRHGSHSHGHGHGGSGPYVPLSLKNHGPPTYNNGRVCLKVELGGSRCDSAASTDLWEVIVKDGGLHVVDRFEVSPVADYNGARGIYYIEISDHDFSTHCVVQLTVTTPRNSILSSAAWETWNGGKNWTHRS